MSIDAHSAISAQVRELAQGYRDIADLYMADFLDGVAYALEERQRAIDESYNLIISDGD